MTTTAKNPPPLTPRCDCCPLVDEVAELRQEVANLSELVRTDPLTGIPNLRHFFQALEQELERTRRSGQPTCLVMLDIDHFKQVNDTWGHDVGNQALIHITRIMLDTLRRLDTPCRYGGEEFAIILPHTDLAAGIRVAERLRQAIAATPLPLPQVTLTLTASLGIEVCNAGQEMAVETWVHQADQYMYQAKQQGRNRLGHPPLPMVDTSSGVGQDEKSALLGWSNTAAAAQPTKRSRKNPRRGRKK